MRRTRFLALLAIALALGIGSVKYFRHKPSASTITNAVVEKPNLLLITIDTIRPDHLSAYGYKSIQTPAIDRLARGGVLFKDAVCQTPLTLVSHSSIFTGLNPNVHGVRDNAYFTLPDQYRTLAEYLKPLGYRTAAFVGSAVLDRRYGLGQGFDYYSRYQATSVIGLEAQRRAEEVTAEALHWLQELEAADSKYFVWVHLFDPHSPYDPPEPFRSQYSSSLYDGEIAYTDRMLGIFLDQLQSIGSLKNTVIVLMGDHGESLGEHREQDHGFFIYDATLKIPLIVFWPGHLNARVVDHQVQSIDLLPTLAELLKFPVEGIVQGRTMMPLIQGKLVERPDAYGEILTPRLYYGWSELKSLRNNEWKYIEAPQQELYNLKQDPHELHNLAFENPDIVQRMKEQLKKFVKMETTTQDAKTKSIDAERIEQLVALGYIGVENPATMLNGTLSIDPKSKIEDYLILRELVPQAVAFIDKGNYREALGLLKKVEVRFANSFVLLWYEGHCYAKLGEAGRAQQAYSRSIELNPYFGRAYTDLSLTLAVLNKHQEAIQLITRAPPSAVSIADREYAKGEIYMHAGSLKEAEDSYHSALTADSENAEAKYGLARLYLASGRIEAAVTQMQNLADIRYLSEDVYYSLASIYEKQGMNDRAEKILQEWVDLYPRSASACYKYGLFLAAKGQRQQAIRYLEKSLQNNPRMKEASQALKMLRVS